MTDKFATIPEIQRRIALYEDMNAYRRLYDLLGPCLLRFSTSIVKSREAAEEIVSDVFIKVWMIRANLQDVDNLKVYLYTITKNFSLNYITRHHKLTVVSINDIDLDTLVVVNNPESAYLSSELVNRIRFIIASLPPQCKLIFQLVKDEGLKYKEVAEILNISVLTVRNQVAIALKKISDALPASATEAMLSRFSNS